MPIPDPPTPKIDLEPSVTATGTPFVSVLLDGKLFGQLTPDEAKDLGVRAITASIDADRDAAIVDASHSIYEGQGDVARLRFVTSLLSLVRVRRGQPTSDARQDQPAQREAS